MNKHVFKLPKYKHDASKMVGAAGDFMKIYNCKNCKYWISYCIPQKEYNKATNQNIRMERINGELQWVID